MTADELFTLLLFIAIISGILMVAALVSDAITRYRSRHALARADAELDRLILRNRQDRRKQRITK